jgi:SAM-dependent methyltransferase
MATRPPGAGRGPDPYADALDWGAVWTARKTRHLAVPGFREGPGFFQQPANIERFFSRRSAPNPRFERQLALLRARPGSAVLDIGPGPGNLAVPLAADGRRVVAVEPAAPMRDLLARNAADAGVEVEVVPLAWEDIDPAALGGPFDLVIASFSLSMVDIRAALEKMHAVCSGEVHLWWFLTPPPWGRVLRELWPEVHGAEYHVEPMAGCLFNVLLQMGVVPAFEPEFTGGVHRYGSLDETVDEFAHRVNRRDGTYDEVIRSGVRRLFRQERDGTWVLDHPGWQAHLWWSARDQAVSEGIRPVY